MTGRFRRVRQGLLRLEDRELTEVAVRAGLIGPEQAQECLRSGRPAAEALARAGADPGRLRKLALELAGARTAGRGMPPDVRVVAADPGRWSGSWIRVRKIGGGSMGEVWKAWDTELGRWVAIKFLKADSFEARARFAREARLAGRLGHPGIVPIHAVGRQQQDGTPFIVMRFVEGSSAQDRIFTIPEALEAVRDAARAVQHAHDQGVVHRDIKPGNLLVDAGGGVLLADFGLSRSVDEPPGISLPGVVVGTPAFMAPEQADGFPATAAADVYSLGATLYQLCTGRPPYEGSSAEVIARLRQGPPARPRRDGRPLSTDVEGVLRKAMHRDPLRRYARADDLAEDLQRILDGRAPRAQPRGRLWIPAVAAAIAIAGVLAARARPDARPAEDASAVRSESNRRRLAADRLRPATQALDLWEFWNRDLPAGSGPAVASAIREAMAVDPDFGPAWVEEGRLRWHDGNLDGAREAFGRAIADLPDGAEGCFHRALLALSRHERQQRRPGSSAGAATGVRFRAPVSSERSPDLRLPEEAIMDLEEYAKHRPGGDSDARVAFAAGLARYARAVTREDYLEAAARMEPAIAALRVSPAVGNAQLGLAWMRAGDFERAVRSFDRSLQSGRQTPDVWRWKGIALMSGAAGRPGLLSGAVESFSRALEIGGDAFDVLYYRGTARLQEARVAPEAEALLRAAIADLKRAIEMEPGIAEPHNNLGNARLRLAIVLEARGEDAAAEREEALRNHAEAVRLAPGWADAWNNLGNSRQAQIESRRGAGGDPEALLRSAVEDYSRALALEGRVAEIWRNRGRVRLRLAQLRAGAGSDPAADLDAGRADLDRAIELQPGFGKAWADRGCAAMLEGRWGPARTDLERAASLDPALAEECRRRIEECEKRLPR